MEEKKTIDCPYCAGTGQFVRRKGTGYYTDEQRKKALKLWQQGVTLREIGKQIGMKEPVNPQRVKSLIQVYINRLAR